MFAQASQTLFSPTTLLWVVASFVAIVLLIAAASRRKTNLADALRAYVDRHQPKPPSSASPSDSDDPSVADE